MKPYRTIPIEECGEPLVPIPQGLFAFYDPPPYQALGASYGAASPWVLREGVVKALVEVQKSLASLKPGWKILVFDGYRPNAVQAYMVEHEFRVLAQESGLNPDNLTDSDREELGMRVFRIWGQPSEDPATPPPHSTGGAVDITLADEAGREVDMGSPIDENSDRSNPDYFANAQDEAGRAAHINRSLLRDIMQAKGFQMHETEWWHFSLGDQYWAWREKETGGRVVNARYGRADLLDSGK